MKPSEFVRSRGAYCMSIPRSTAASMVYGATVTFRPGFDERSTDSSDLPMRS
jgi:hypothetical protein